MELNEIKQWSDERLITQNTPDKNGYNAMIVEELAERIDGILDGNEEEVVDAICDITVFAIGEIYKFGYITEDVVDCGKDYMILDWLDISDNKCKLTNKLKIRGIDYTSRIVYYLGKFLGTESKDLRVEAMKNMIFDSYNELVWFGYDPDRCMDEVMKELNSRTGEYCEETKKWQKFKTPEAKALWYKADFSKCKF
jgi:hypothetical protein